MNVIIVFNKILCFTLCCHFIKAISHKEKVVLGTPLLMPNNAPFHSKMTLPFLLAYCFEFIKVLQLNSTWPFHQLLPVHWCFITLECSSFCLFWFVSYSLLLSFEFSHASSWILELTVSRTKTLALRWDGMKRPKRALWPWLWWYR